jgi:AcrR family transcriptional regulator
MKSGERRAAIVESAIRLFAEKGFRGTTTRELATALGVTEPVIYQHFRAKQDLYTAIIEAKTSAAASYPGRFQALAESGDDRAFFTALGNLVLESFENDPELMRLLLYSSLERHQLSDLFFDSVIAGFLKMVSGYIRRRIRCGAFLKINPDIAARGLIGMFHYHGLIGMLHPGKLGKPGRRKLVDEIVTLFLAGMLLPPGEN